ncbi:DUF4352 domain-containing protein [Candidatus Bathyarchaeota archaeon]|nr:DUF4352 domain-containing protein [Candidatus Bathyarchaeota archaeon]
MRNINNKRALSPVIATVILVAVAITVAVAVAYWMGGIAGQYTKFEKVEITSVLCTYNASSEIWTITLGVKNTGTAQATLDKVFINSIEITDYSLPPATDGAAHNMGANGMTLTSGQPGTIIIQIERGWQTVSSGTTLNVKLHSTGGMEYLKMVELV